MSDPLLVAKSISKTYGDDATRVLQILKSVDLQIYPGEALCILGSSGAGKSTLLHILGTLDKPSGGELLYRGESLLKKSDAELAQFRNETMGFVFQFHHLLNEFTALENAAMPALIGGLKKSEALKKAQDLLETLGLSDRLHHYPSQLSGGEQQRVAIARALVQSPKILFADEPTGNLDRQNGRMIEDLFFALRDRLGLTLVVVTHDTQFAGRFPRRLQLRDGQWN
jgi:lipoprotein-releasing system ATP-binding protein